MSGNEPDQLGERCGIVIVTPQQGGTVAEIQQVIRARPGARSVLVSQEVTGTAMTDLAARCDELFREPATIGVCKLMLRVEKAYVAPPILRKKTAYERANPNPPFYVKLRKEDKRKNRHGKK